jgi:phosphohistidine phosphatase
MDAAATRRQLILLRHAKAEKDGPSDHERELAPAGRRDATEVGRRLRAAGLSPDLAIVSPSTRTRQTWQRVAAELRSSAQERFEPALYDNEADGVLELVRAVPDDVGTLLLVGHNPSVEELASQLDDGRGDASARQAMTAGFSTSALAVLSHGGSWGLVARGRLRVESFVPRRP